MAVHGKIFGAMIEAKRRIGPIAKARFADAGSMKFAFRGIDDLIDAVFPILNDLGILLVAEVKKVEETTRGEKQLPFTRIHMSYKFYCDDESCIVSEAVGQAVSGQKGGDKEATVAQSVALRIMLATTFSIPFSDMVDPEEFDHPDAPPARSSSKFLTDLDAISRRDGLADFMRRVIEGIEAGTGMPRAKFMEYREDILACARRVGFDEKAVAKMSDRILEVGNGKKSEPVTAPAEKASSSSIAENVIGLISGATNRDQFEVGVRTAATAIANGDLERDHALEIAKAAALFEDTSCHLLMSLIRATSREAIGAVSSSIGEMEVQRKVSKETAASLRSAAAVLVGAMK